MRKEEEHWEAVDGYISRQLFWRDLVLEAVLAANAAAGLPSIEVSPAQGKLLQLLARISGARRVLEIGVFWKVVWVDCRA
jgi:predicted O-methyltransferase YrrM